MQSVDDLPEDDELKGRFRKIFEDDEESLSQSRSKELWYKIASDLPTAAPDGLGQFGKLMAADEVIPMAATWEKIAAAIGYSIWVQPRTWYWSAASLAGISATLLLVLNFMVEHDKQAASLNSYKTPSATLPQDLNAISFSPLKKWNKEDLMRLSKDRQTSSINIPSEKSAPLSEKSPYHLNNKVNPTLPQVPNQPIDKPKMALENKSPFKSTEGREYSSAISRTEKTKALNRQKRLVFSNSSLSKVNSKSEVISSQYTISDWDIAIPKDDHKVIERAYSDNEWSSNNETLSGHLLPSINSKIKEDDDTSISIQPVSIEVSTNIKDSASTTPKGDTLAQSSAVTLPSLRQPIIAPIKPIWPNRWFGGISFDYLSRITGFNTSDDIYLTYKNNQQIATRNSQSFHLGGIYQLGLGWEIVAMGEYLEVKSVNQFKGDRGQVVHNDLTLSGNTVQVIPMLRYYETTISKTSRYTSLRIEPGYFFGKDRSGLTLRAFGSVSHLLTNNLQITGEQLPGMIAPPAPNPLWTAGLSLGYRYPISTKLSVEFDAHYRQFIGIKQVTSTFTEQLRSYGLGFKIIY